MSEYGRLYFQTSVRYASINGVHVTGGIRLLTDEEDGQGFVQIVSVDDEVLVTHYVHPMNFLAPSSSAGVAWSSIPYLPDCVHDESNASGSDFGRLPANLRMPKSRAAQCGKVDIVQVVFMSPGDAMRFKTILDAIRGAFETQEVVPIAPSADFSHFINQSGTSTADGQRRFAQSGCFMSESQQGFNNSQNRSTTPGFDPRARENRSGSNHVTYSEVGVDVRPVSTQHSFAQVDHDELTSPSSQVMDRGPSISVRSASQPLNHSRMSNSISGSRSAPHSYSGFRLHSMTDNPQYSGSGLIPGRSQTATRSSSKIPSSGSMPRAASGNMSRAASGGIPQPSVASVPPSPLPMSGSREPLAVPSLGVRGSRDAVADLSSMSMTGPKLSSLAPPLLPGSRGTLGPLSPIPGSLPVSQTNSRSTLANPLSKTSLAMTDPYALTYKSNDPMGDPYTFAQDEVLFMSEACLIQLNNQTQGWQAMHTGVLKVIKSQGNRYSIKMETNGYICIHTLLKVQSDIQPSCLSQFGFTFNAPNLCHRQLSMDQYLLSFKTRAPYDEFMAVAAEVMYCLREEKWEEEQAVGESDCCFQNFCALAPPPVVWPCNNMPQAVPHWGEAAEEEQPRSQD